MLEQNEIKHDNDSKPKIRTLASLGSAPEDESGWQRHAKMTGQGATHV